MSDRLSERSRSVDPFGNARARHTHVKETLHHPFPAQAAFLDSGFDREHLLGKTFGHAAQTDNTRR